MRVAAVAEPSADARTALASAGVAAFATLADLLAGTEIDGLLIAAPTDQHVQLVSEVLAAGLPVLCEKPCGLTVEQAVQCADAAAAAGLLLQVAYWRRFVPELISLREQIAQRRPRQDPRSELLPVGRRAAAGGVPGAAAAASSSTWACTSSTRCAGSPARSSARSGRPRQRTSGSPRRPGLRAAGRRARRRQHRRW